MSQMQCGCFKISPSSIPRDQMEFLLPHLIFLPLFFCCASKPSPQDLQTRHSLQHCLLKIVPHTPQVLESTAETDCKVKLVTCPLCRRHLLEGIGSVVIYFCCGWCVTCRSKLRFLRLRLYLELDFRRRDLKEHLISGFSSSGGLWGHFDAAL